ncbi:MAG: hypothetical protein H6799_00165 [Candidatus Nomurabacteria bacterium]|nr:MAG: hypothetical protein H6799_00165 [Candidatus Nomurabacteria bacterium]HRV76386.1 hypothetical protein [Candidatus Saccharimonadales bacterium]
MKIKSLITKTTIVLLAVLSPLITPSEIFALKTEPVTLQEVPASSSLAPQIVGSSTYTYVEPFSNAQTEVTNENEGHWYGWTFNVADLLPCPSATLHSLHILANNSLETEGNPDWSVMSLSNVVDGTSSPVIPQRPVTQGFSPDVAPHFVGRWSVGSENFPPATSEWSIGIEGPMEATWDVSGLDLNNDFLLAVGHDAEDETVGLQTTIQSVEALFDDSSCDSAPPTSNNNQNSPQTPNSPKTGSIGSIILLLSILIAMIFLTLKTAQRLKSKH